jgi:hypothetical protein
LIDHPAGLRLREYIASRRFETHPRPELVPKGWPLSVPGD